MSINHWKDYIAEQYHFYRNAVNRKRTDKDFPFDILSNNKISVKGAIAKIPFAVSMYHFLKGTSLFEDWMINKADQLYEVRNLFEDELSKVLFDNAIILRLVGHKNFYFPKLYFDELIRIDSKKKFIKEGFPGDYSGLPLYMYSASVIGSCPDFKLQFIANDGFVPFTNSYRQYLLSRNQIVFKPEKGDILIDCGACIGDMSAIFASMVGPAGQVHIFDPIPLHIKFCQLQSALNHELSDVFYFNTYAVGERSAVVNKGKKIDSDSISPGGLAIDQFDTISLDDYLLRNTIQKVDFIKMDVEGAEPESLRGAKNIITEFKPKLAISTYHHPDHFWSIPLQIKSLNSDYKLSFGHHSPVSWESVIYAY